MSKDANKIIDGFEFGCVAVERMFIREETGAVTIRITTPKHPLGLQVYVTKTGKMRLFLNHKELEVPKK